MHNFRFNILRQVHRLKGTQEFSLRKFLGRRLNLSGYRESIFAPPTLHRGCVQWVITSQYKSLNLDLSKYYIKVYFDGEIKTLDRDGNADEIIWNGSTFHPIPSQHWISQGGWCSVLAVRIKKT